MSTAVIGTKIYLFGGYYSNSTILNTINCFDTETQTLTTLSATLPKAISFNSAAAVGAKIYLFGGENFDSGLDTIYCLDTETQKITTSTTILPRAITRMSAAAVGTKIYLFGGEYAVTSSMRILGAIRCFDTETQALTLASMSLFLPLDNPHLAAVGTKIYVLGGNGTDIIECIDTEMQTATVLSETLPSKLLESCAVAVGTKIYLFGGYYDGSYKKTIYCFDTQTDKVSTLSASLSVGTRSIGAAAVGTKIYLFGGLAYHLTLNSQESAAIRCFDTETQTITTLSTTLPKASYDIGAAAVGTKIYLFGGHHDEGYFSSIRCFDTETQTLTTLSATLPIETYGISATTVGTKIYLDGGDKGDGTIYCFNTETQTITALDKKLPLDIDLTGGMVTIGTKIYLLGGTETSYNPPMYDTIDVYYTAFELATGAVQIVPSLHNNIFKIINRPDVTMEIGVSNVYVGNTDSQAVKAEACLHNGSNWEPITEMTIE
jgi:N-acetylneuraminic acid mutarotase